MVKLEKMETMSIWGEESLNPIDTDQLKTLEKEEGYRHFCQQLNHKLLGMEPDPRTAELWHGLNETLPKKSWLRHLKEDFTLDWEMGLVASLAAYAVWIFLLANEVSAGLARFSNLDGSLAGMI
ncbi:hypothetical protein HOF92_12015 [bacterium]|jgi:hypothetical protein|nr:hypothetical protein [bacterium]